MATSIEQLNVVQEGTRTKQIIPK